MEALGKSGASYVETRDHDPSGLEVANAMLPGKPSKLRYVLNRTQTDTGGQVENTKAVERTRVKELGKMAP
jgi:hypothetical protein